LRQENIVKKNPLKFVASTRTTALTPPVTLGKAGATLWKTIQTEYRIEDAGGREILLQICAATDDLAECDAAIAHDGAVIQARNGVLKEHPLCRRQLAIRAFICRSVQRLGLTLETTKPIGRPPGLGGPTYEDFDSEDDE
jgi:hypothetical protein